MKIGNRQLDHTNNVETDDYLQIGTFGGGSDHFTNECLKAVYLYITQHNLKEMKKPSLALLLIPIFMSTIITSCSEKQEYIGSTTWAEKLGFPAGKRVIILHADDAGMCDEANIATAQLLINKEIQSAAVMVPCPKADEFIEWALEHPETDVGLHLTLNSEWKTHRWGPVSDPAQVPGLIDPEGMLWHTVPEVLTNATVDEVEAEIRAQIDKAIDMGYQPGHIDTHMGTLYSHPDYVKVFYKLAEEYQIPANAIDLSDSLVVDILRKAGYPIDDSFISLAAEYSLPKLDFITWVPYGETYEEKIEEFKTLIRSLSPGLTEIVFHPSVETENLKTITNSWQQRVWEAEMFSDPDLIRFFKEEEIIFTNWIKVMKRFSES